MNILFTIWDYSELSGSQMHVYELSKELTKIGCDCSIAALAVGGEIRERSLAQGVKVFNLNDLYLFKEDSFDLIHCHQNKTAKFICDRELFPSAPLIQTCHSEILEIEKPYLHPRVLRYITVRNTIQKLITSSEYPVPLEITELIYNPIDQNRFNIEGATDGGFVLFVGSVDYLRINPLRDVIVRAAEKGQWVYVVGRINDEYREELKGKCSPFGVEFGVEKTVKVCSWAAGIINGRTGIEALFCGKDYLDYIVDEKGEILHTVKSTQEVFNKFPERWTLFHSDYVANQTLSVYQKVINQFNEQ